MKIIYEDTSLLAVIKPAGMPVQPDKTGDADILSQVSAYLGKPAGLLHRLDRPVGGMVLFAKTKEAERILSEAMQQNRIKKQYLSVVLGCPESSEGHLRHFLQKNGRTNLSQVTDSNAKDAKEARLSYRVLSSIDASDEHLSLLLVQLETGRHHQIRVQLAHIGIPIWGDKKYNSIKQSGHSFPALWSAGLHLIHPETGMPLHLFIKPDTHPFHFFSETLKQL